MWSIFVKPRIANDRIISPAIFKEVDFNIFVQPCGDTFTAQQMTPDKYMKTIAEESLEKATLHLTENGND